MLRAAALAGHWLMIVGGALIGWISERPLS